MPSEVVHMIPMKDAVTPCCHRTVHELPMMDRITVRKELVTCGKSLYDQLLAALRPHVGLGDPGMVADAACDVLAVLRSRGIQ